MLSLRPIEPTSARTGRAGTVGLPAGRARRRRSPPLVATLSLLPALLAGCVASGSGLVPPLPVPDAAGRPSAPDNFADTGQGPGTQMFAGRAPVARSALPPPSDQTIRTRSEPPVAARTLSQPAPPASGGPQRARAFPADTAPAAAASPPVRSAPEPTQAEPALTIRFTPVIGAPISAIRPLSSALEKSAEDNGIAIQTAADSPPDNILRGYFSASRSGKRTQIVYVWDVLDGSGNQLYRIQETRTIRGASPGNDVWQGIPASAMQAIARETIAAYLKWRHAQTG